MGGDCLNVGCVLTWGPGFDEPGSIGREGLAPAPGTEVIAKYADGAPALTRRYGSVNTTSTIVGVVKRGDRTALAYLTQPLTDSINRAWREQ